MIQVGGHAATLIDFEIPARHGLRQTIGDTLGHRRHLPRAAHDPGDARRSARDMAELCPDAWLLNYTNPMAMLCWAYVRTARRSTKVVGLCHSVQHTTRTLAELRRRPVRGGRRSSAPASTTRRSSCASSATARTSTRCWTRRSSAIPELQRRVRVEMYRRLRLLPDRVERALGRVPAVVHARRRDDRALPAAGRRVRPAQRGEPRGVRADRGRSWRPASRSRSSAASSTRSLIVHSMVTGRSRGHLRQRPQRRADRPTCREGACVEVPCVVDRTGVQPTRVGALPPQLRRAQPHVPERRRADGAGGARGQPRARATTPRCSTRTPPRRCRPTRSTRWSTSCSRPTRRACPRGCTV